jgi:hypothetical protein
MLAWGARRAASDERRPIGRAIGSSCARTWTPQAAARSREARRPVRAPVSPVAPRRTVVAAVLRPTGHGLPCEAPLLSGASYSVRVPVRRVSSPVCSKWSRRAPAGPIQTHGLGSQGIADGLLRGPHAGLRRRRSLQRPRSTGRLHLASHVACEPAPAASGMPSYFTTCPGLPAKTKLLFIWSRSSSPMRLNTSAHERNDP